MKELIAALKNRKDGEKTDITFTNGDIIILKDFEMVDPSIYDKDNLVIAYICSVKHSPKNHYDIGIFIEFEIEQIALVKDSATQITIWPMATESGQPNQGEAGPQGQAGQ